MIIAVIVHGVNATFYLLNRNVPLTGGSFVSNFLLYVLVVKCVFYLETLLHDIGSYSYLFLFFRKSEISPEKVSFSFLNVDIFCLIIPMRNKCMIIKHG